MNRGLKNNYLKKSIFILYLKNNLKNLKKFINLLTIKNKLINFFWKLILLKFIYRYF